MDMGDSDGGGVGVGVLLSGGSFFGTFVIILVMIGIHCYCDSREHEEQHRFCAEVCSQYHDKPVIKGSQCYCRDAQGIYDPATPRTPAPAEKPVHTRVPARASTPHEAHVPAR